MDSLPFPVTLELKGWQLFWAYLELKPGTTKFPDEVRQRVAEKVNDRVRLVDLSTNPVVAGIRKLFRETGCDPTRYRPSSEALLRRLLKGEEMPCISPLVDLSNCLSASLMVPCCVMAETGVTPPFVFRKGLPGESYESLRGPFNLEAKPVLADLLGACDAPITGGQRVKVTEETQRVWLVAYMPLDLLSPGAAEIELSRLVDSAPLVKVHLTAIV